MKTSLWALGVVVAVPSVLVACGEEAPPTYGQQDDGTMEGETVPGMAFPGSPSGPSSPPGNVTPGNVTPGNVTPGNPTPGEAPGGNGPPALQPGVMTGGDQSGGAGASTTPLVPPMQTAAPTQPPATGVPAPTTATPVPEPGVTPAEMPAEAMCKSTTWTVGSSGYVSAPGATSCWQGYAWASATPMGESTVTPEEFSACGADCTLCASGTVAPTEDYSGVALLGFNVAQVESSTATGTLTPSGSVTINVTNTGGSPLRVQLNGTGANQWCKDISDVSGEVTIPLSDFQLECWEGGANTPYSSGTIEAIVLLVPGSNVDETPFDICLNSVTPG